MKPNIDFRELNLINRDYSKYIFEILGRLFFEMFVEKYDLSRIKKIYLCNISIDKLDFEALGNLLYLEELEMYRTKFKNIYFSELFCTSREYKIKRLKFTKINIKESDFNFISNLKKLKTLQFYECKIQTPTHSGTNMKLKKEFELEIRYKKYDLSAEIIQLIRSFWTETCQYGTSMGVIISAEMHEEPIPPLNEAKKEEDGVKILKLKNNTPLISQRGTTLEE
ncbi:hypothetical protein CWI38_2425p0010, partial [Hamiltosporidium tvaerminnensis]